MSHPKPPRTPAGDLGTADRIECGQGLYWVRLVTRQAIQREGECLQNCCRSYDSYSDYAGSENPMDGALWSLRNSYDGISLGLAEVYENGTLECFLSYKNEQPRASAFRQLRHLRDFRRGFGGDLTFRHGTVLVDERGVTHRPDLAPVELREAEAARVKAEEVARRAERQATMRDLYEGGAPATHYEASEFRGLRARVTMIDEVDSDWAPGWRLDAVQRQIVNHVAQGVRYDPATSYQGVLPSGLLYSTTYGPGECQPPTRIVTTDGRRVRAFTVLPDGAIMVECDAPPIPARDVMFNSVLGMPYVFPPCQGQVDRLAKALGIPVEQVAGFSDAPSSLSDELVAMKEAVERGLCTRANIEANEPTVITMGIDIAVDDTPVRYDAWVRGVMTNISRGAGL